MSPEGDLRPCPSMHTHNRNTEELRSGPLVQYLNNKSRGQNLSSSSGETWVCFAVILWNSSLRIGGACTALPRVEFLSNPRRIHSEEEDEEKEERGLPRALVCCSTTSPSPSPGPFREAQISEQPLWGFSSSNPDRSQSRAEQSLYTRSIRIA
jgi:hypothetical protein